MPWSTEHTLNPKVGGARTNGDTVIPGPDGGLNYADAGGHLNMDAICVRAVPCRFDVNTLNPYSLAAKDDNVVQLAVDRR